MGPPAAAAAALLSRPAAAVVRRARRERRALRRMVTEELSSPLRLSEPAMLLRGFRSDNRWFYSARPSRAAGYLSDLGYLRASEGLNPPAVNALFSDKGAFDRAVRERGLGAHTPQLLATVDDGVVTRHMPWCGPVARKPAGGAGGHGFALFDSLEEGLATCPPTGRHLLQEEVAAHPYGRELFPGSLNTLRIMALRPATAAPPVLAAAVQRIGRARSAPVDSGASGGLVSRVDLCTGRLSPAVGMASPRCREVFDDHPETGTRITGRVVPGFPDALGLVQRLMEAFPEARHVGWDVAVGERGPLVLEGNTSRPSVRSLQAHGPFTADPAVWDFYAARGLLPRRRPSTAPPPGGAADYPG